ncbi:MAG: terminase gpA endonuclease subunit [Aureliella sp.]
MLQVFWRLERHSRERVSMAEVNADHWKTWVHQRLTSPVNKPGAMTFYQASPQDHFALAKHLTAEVKTEEFVSGKGVVAKWERNRRQNHWFDALYNACAAGNYLSARLVKEIVPERKPQPRTIEVDPDPVSWQSADAARWRAMSKRIWGS